MHVEILQGGRVLRCLSHEGKNYIEAPPEGEYQIRLTNNCPRRRIAVISVDGINVIDGEEAGFDGSGYVMRAWESMTIKGWRRSDSEVAAFSFTASEASYSNKTGKGTKNTGVIGLAVFDEKDRSPKIIREDHHHFYPLPHPWMQPIYPIIWTTHTGTPLPQSTFSVSDNTRHDGHEVYCSNADYGPRLGRNMEVGETLSLDSGVETVVMPCSASVAPEAGSVSSDGFTLGRERARGVATKGVADSIRENSTLGRVRSRKSPFRSAAPSLGTGYGGRQTMHTETTTFERATAQPCMVLSLYYGTTEKLREWGVPLDAPEQPEAFPASAGPRVAAPSDWRG